MTRDSFHAINENDRTIDKTGETYPKQAVGEAQTILFTKAIFEP